MAMHGIACYGDSTTATYHFIDKIEKNVGVNIDKSAPPFLRFSLTLHILSSIIRGSNHGDALYMVHFQDCLNMSDQAG